MAAIQRFEDMEVWQNARELTLKIYAETWQGEFSKDFGLRDQIQRAAISVMSNIAEGFERGTNKEFIQFLFIAKGSAGDLEKLRARALMREFEEHLSAPRASRQAGRESKQKRLKVFRPEAVRAGLKKSMAGTQLRHHHRHSSQDSGQDPSGKSQAPHVVRPGGDQNRR